MEGKAETEGFEPSIELPLYTLSKRAPSATRTNLHFLQEGKNTVSVPITRIFFLHWLLLLQQLLLPIHFLFEPAFQ